MPEAANTVLVLGCGGFIGSHLTERLLAGPGYDVLGVDRTSAKIRSLLDHPRLEYIETDLNEGVEVTDLVERADIVVHLAALCNPSLYNTRPLDVIETNFISALPVVRACAELGKRLVHFSTCEVYGKTLAGSVAGGEGITEDPRNFLLSEETSPLILGPVVKQRWSYSCAKQLLERTIFAEGMEHNLEYTIIRPFNVVGPRMDFIPGVDGEGIPRVVPCFMRALLYGEPLQLVDGGRSRRSFIYIDDAVDAVMRMIERPEKSAKQVLNVGNPDNEITIAELAEMMVEIYGEKSGGEVKSGVVKVTPVEFYGEGYDDCDRRVPDMAKAERLLDWRPSTSLRDLLEKTMDWYMQEYGEGLR